jgi:hypothetical protein
MKRRDHYLASPHDRHVHFWCRLVFGPVLGAWLVGDLFSNGWALTAFSFVIAVSTAFSCARRGDEAWEWLLHWFR